MNIRNSLVVLVAFAAVIGLSACKSTENMKSDAEKAMKEKETQMKEASEKPIIDTETGRRIN